MEIMMGALIGMFSSVFLVFAFPSFSLLGAVILYGIPIGLLLALGLNSILEDYS